MIIEVINLVEDGTAAIIQETKVVCSMVRVQIEVTGATTTGKVIIKVITIIIGVITKETTTSSRATMLQIISGK